MSNPTRLKAYGQNTPLVDVFPFPLTRNRAPTGDDRGYEIGQEWIYRNGDTVLVYVYGGVSSTNQGIWPASATSSGDLSTLQGGTGGLISPVSQNIIIAGSTNINTVGTAGTITINLDDTIVISQAIIGNIAITNNSIVADNVNGNVFLEPNGTGKVSISYATANAIPVFTTSGFINEVGPLTDGQFVIGKTGLAPVAGSLTSSDNSISIISSPGVLDLTIINPTIIWSVETGSNSSIQKNVGVFCNNATSVTVTLPAVAAIGDTFQISAMNATGTFIINYGAGQSIRVGNTLSTVTSGTLTSTAIGDWIEIVCNIANTGFIANMRQGNVIIT